MNVLFMCLGMFDNLNVSSIHIDLLKEFVRNGHMIYLVCKRERRTGKKTEFTEEYGIHVLRVKTGNIKKTNIIEKGVSTILVESNFKIAIKEFLPDIKFDLVLYTTPPITFANVIQYIQKRDGAKTYLLLKDIFPQNAVDIGMMCQSGLTGLLYKYFRKKEKQLYSISDRIGCMSQANVDYLLKHNHEVSPEKVEICPNSIEVRDLSLAEDEKNEMRRKYDLPCEKKIFVYGGNLGKPQGIPFLMECLFAEKNNTNVFFLISGDGTEYGKLEAFINENTLSNVRLLKSLPKKEYDRLVAACDVGMIFLDHRFTIPNFPSRLLSYMQAKLPVLACTDHNTDVGKVIVDGRFGWWCESNDSAKFSDLIKQIENMDSKELGLKGYEYLKQNYSVEIAYEKIAQFCISSH